MIPAFYFFYLWLTNKFPPKITTYAEQIVISHQP